MPILDRLRGSRPDWESTDPQVRAEAVRRLGRREQELLVSIARTDEAPKVRRVAVHKLDELDILAEVARTDDDAGVRDEACEGLLRVACQNDDEGPALQALETLTDARQLLVAARDARLEPVRRQALGRIDDPKSLTTIAKTSAHPDTRLAALAALEAPELVLDVAHHSEHRDSALAALDRVDDEAGLEQVAGHGRNKAAARRARSRLEKLRPPEPVAEPPAQAAAEEPAPEAPAAIDSPEAPAAVSAPDEAGPPPEPTPPEIAAREALCQKAEALQPDADTEAVASLEQEWQSLSPTDLPGVGPLTERFGKALERYRTQVETARQLAEARPAQLAACEVLEGFVAAQEPPTDDAWEQARATWKALEEAGPVDPELAARVAAVTRLRREHDAAQALARKQRLQAAAERLEGLSKAETLDLREVEAALREAREAMSDRGRLPSRRDREQLFEQIRAARASIFPKAQELREADEWTRWANVATLEELCARVDALQESSDLDALARELREIDTRWKAAHPVPRDEGAALWSRFRTAREPLRKRVSEHLAKRRAQRAASTARRKEMIARAEELRESTDWVATATELQALQAEWRTLPPLGRRQSEALWKHFHDACQAFFGRRKADLHERRKGQAENLEKKQALIDQAEALSQSTDWETAAAEVRRLQTEWKQVGPVRRSRSEVLWERFKKACDAFFERYRHKDEIVDEAAAAERASVCEALEALLAAEGVPDDLAASVGAQVERWRGLPVLRGPNKVELERRFAAARDGLVAAHPEAFAGTGLDPTASLPRRRKLCDRVEAHLPSEKPMDLAAQLREALATNAMGGASATQARAREAAADIKSARAAWDRLGPVIGADAQALAERFEAACKRFRDANPNADAPMKVPGPSKSRSSRPRPQGSRGRRPR